MTGYAKGRVRTLASGAALAAALVGAGATGASAFHDVRRDHYLTIHHRYGPPKPGLPIAAPIDIPLDGTGVFFRTPFFEVSAPDSPPVIVRVPHYQGPDGAYDDLADLTNAIQGTPCGQECTARSLVRWGYLPAD